jgi:Ser/Thr protein kinase RdoA (MazF antagonist)
METYIEQAFTNDIKKHFEKVFQINISDKPIGDFENFVFTSENSSGVKTIFRATHSSHRTLTEIEGEIEFINFLAQNGASVNIPYISSNSKFIESIKSNNGDFFGVHFSFIEGKFAKSGNSEIWNDDLFYKWGKTIGQFHRIMATYPKNGKRKDWFEYETEREKYIPSQEIKQKYTKLINKIDKLPKDNNCYGLIHSDIHPGNFLYNEGKISVYDFDDSMYCYFIQDIAMVIYYSLFFKGYSEEDKIKEASRILEHFRMGYETEYILDQFWYKNIELFFRLRDYSIYSVLHQKFEGKERPDNLQKLFLELENRIEENKPIVELEL